MAGPTPRSARGERGGRVRTAAELPVGDPDAVSYALAEYADDPGNIDYQHRMQTWIVGGSSPDQIYASLFAHDPRDLGA